MERNLKQIPNLLSRHFFPPLHLSLQSNTVVSYGFTPLHSYTAYGSFSVEDTVLMFPHLSCLQIFILLSAQTSGFGSYSLRTYASNRDCYCASKACNPGKRGIASERAWEGTVQSVPAAGSAY